MAYNKKTEKKSFVHNESSGSLFVNTYRKSENQPTHKGSCNIGGTNYNIGAWEKESKTGNTFLSLKFTPEDKQETPF